MDSRKYNRSAAGYAVPCRRSSMDSRKYSRSAAGDAVPCRRSSMNSRIYSRSAAGYAVPCRWSRIGKNSQVPGLQEVLQQWLWLCYFYSRTKGNGLRGGNCKNILFVLKHNSSTFISQIKTFFIYIFPPVRECMQNIQQILSLSRLFPLERVPLDAKLSLFLL